VLALKYSVVRHINKELNLIIIIIIILSIIIKRCYTEENLLFYNVSRVMTDVVLLSFE